MAAGKDDEEMALLNISLLHYLIDKGHLDELYDQCINLTSSENQSAAIYKLRLQIDVFLLLQDDATLGNLLLHKPSQGYSLFHSLIFTITQDMGWLPPLSSHSQLLLLLRLTALPSFPPYQLYHISELPRLEDGEGQFLSFTGIVCCMSEIEKYTESACFHCTDTSCTNNSQHIRMHTTGSNESTTMRDDLYCVFCGSLLIEDVSQRTLADKLVITVVPNDGLFYGGTFSSERYQGFTVILRDDLCGCVQMGGAYTVIGVPVHSTVWTNGSCIVHTVIEANNVYPSVCNVVEELPVQISDVYSACQYSQWAFPATIAYSFGAHIAPPGVYHRLKLVLLLSLVASFTNDHSHRFINLLITGSECDSIVGRLLSYGSSLSHRPILHGTGMSLTASMRKDTTGIQWTDAGSLLLAAQGGVCLLNNINQWKKDEREKLQHILVSNEVPLAKGKAPPVSLSCTLWMSCDCHVTSTKDKPLHEKSGLNKGLVDQCGLIVVTDCPSQNDEVFIDTVISTHLLERAKGHCTPSLLTTDDIRKFLSVCSSLSVTLHSTAHQLLRGYYMTSRRGRGIDTPLTALDTLISVTIAHARLNLHTVASEYDALIAILLYEESLMHRYGHSSLFIQPSPHLRESQSVSSLIGKEFDQHMTEFYEQVKVLIRDHTHNMFPFQREE